MPSGASSAMEDLLKPTVVLKAHPPKVLAKTSVLQPLMIVPRECLPLSFLDLAEPTGDLYPSRLYESHVRILDLESRRGSGPHVLIARLETTGSLHAIEKHEKGLYTACKLGSWVEVGKLSLKATIACRQVLELSKAVVVEAKEQKASPPITTPGLHKAQSRKRLAIEALQSVVRKKARPQSVVVSTLPSLSEGERGTSTVPASRQDTPSAGPRSEALEYSRHGSQAAPSSSALVQPSTPFDPEPLAPPPTGGELLDRIRKQYFEALYNSKVS